MFCSAVTDTDEQLGLPFLLCRAIDRPDGSLRERKDEPPERPGTEGAIQERVWWRFCRRQPLVQVIQAPDGFRFPGSFIR